uniref:BRCT domain-containing protein n=1 Tax=Aegilops tauschii subsp. strangulata TaxID=200361 RepID=A0A453H5C7_AEGTS
MKQIKISPIRIVDRPTQSHVFLSRHYVQPQWIFDCVNILKVIPTDDYIVGRVPPPHISPFVDNDKEGHIPDYAVTLEGYKSAGQNQVMPLPGLGDEDLGNSIVEAKSEHNEFAKKKKELEMQEKKYHEELKMEIEGTTFSNLSNKKADSAADVADEDEAQAAIDQAEKDADDIAKSVVSRRKRGLIEAMQISNDRKKSKVELLKQRKKAAESSASAKAKRR